MADRKRGAALVPEDLAAIKVRKIKGSGLIPTDTGLDLRVRTTTGTVGDAAVAFVSAAISAPPAGLSTP